MRAYTICILNNTEKTIIARGSLDDTTRFATNRGLSKSQTDAAKAEGRTTLDIRETINAGGQECYKNIDALISLDVFDEANNRLSINKQRTTPNANTIIYTITEKN